MKKLIFISFLFLSFVVMGQNIKTTQEENVTFCRFNYFEIGKIQIASKVRSQASKIYSSELKETTYSINFLINYPARISINGGEQVLVKLSDESVLALTNTHDDYGEYSTNSGYWTGYFCDIEEDDLKKIASIGLAKIRFGSTVRNIDVEIKKKQSDKFCELLKELISTDVKNAKPDVLKDF